MIAPVSSWQPQQDYVSSQQINSFQSTASFQAAQQQQHHSLLLLLTAAAAATNKCSKGMISKEIKADVDTS
jgi:hypothetical protein